MRWLKSLILILILCGVALEGQTPTYLVWDYPDVDIPNITEFQVKYDNGAYMTVGIPTPEVLSDTQPNHKSFRSLIPSSITTGQNHTAAVRVCNATECSWDASTVFKFIGPPINPRIKK